MSTGQRLSVLAVTRLRPSGSPYSSVPAGCISAAQKIPAPTSGQLGRTARARRAPLPVNALAELRAAASDAIERLIAFVDVIDGDPDLEEDDPAEDGHDREDAQADEVQPVLVVRHIRRSGEAHHG